MDPHTRGIQAALPIYRNFLISGASKGIAAYIKRPTDLVSTQNHVVPKTLTIIIAYNVVKSRNTSHFCSYHQLSAALLKNTTFTNGRWGCGNNLSKYYERMAAYIKRPNALVYTQNNVVPKTLTIIIAYDVVKSRDIIPFSNHHQLSAALLKNTTFTNGRWRCGDLCKWYSQRILNKETVVSLWRAGTSAARRSAVVNALRLATCLQVRDILRPRISNNKLLYFTSSMIAGLLTSFCVLSFNIVITRLQNAAKETSKVSVLKSIIKVEEAGALCTVLLPTFARIGAQTVVAFIVMDQLSNMYKNHSQICLKPEDSN